MSVDNSIILTFHITVFAFVLHLGINVYQIKILLVVLYIASLGFLLIDFIFVKSVGQNILLLLFSSNNSLL